MRNELPLGVGAFGKADDVDRAYLVFLVCLAVTPIVFVGIGIGIGYVLWG